MAEPSVSSIAIYQLRVLLRGVSPLVWRRLLVISETRLAKLHEILQTAFDWSGEHLHRFLIHGAAYGVRTELKISPLLEGIRCLSGEKIQWYLASELRDPHP